MAASPAALGFGEEDQDFSFEDQLAQQESFEDEERWADYAAGLLEPEGPPTAALVEREAVGVPLPVDEVASQQAAFGYCACIQAISFMRYL